MNKYIYTALGVFIATLIITISILSFTVDRLKKDNVILEEKIKSNIAAIEYLETNIDSLNIQYKETEESCQMQIEARDDVISFLTDNRTEPATSLNKARETGVYLYAPVKDKNNEVISKNKSIIAVDIINDYWSSMLPYTNNGKK